VEKVNICRKHREWDDLVQFLAARADYYVMMCSSPEKVAVTLNEALNRVLATAQAMPPAENKYVNTPIDS
jgi:DNA-binding NarL/FixJ family response regulator